MTDFKNTNPQYKDNINNWQLVRDLIKGESALKQHDLDTVKSTTLQNSSSEILSNFKLNRQYLPQPDVQNCEAENTLRYAQYIQRASLFNAVKRTEQGMSGMVFQKGADISLPDDIEYLESDADGSEVGIEQQAQEVLNDVLETGRQGLLVDFPKTDGSVTVQQAEELGVRANIITYKAEQILDWDSIRVNAASKLSLVILLEAKLERNPDDIFSTEESEQVRVLLLNSEGNYEVRVYEDSDKFTTFEPQGKDGKPLKSIPFFFIGAVNNRPSVDPAPLIELAEVNLAHYRNSADFEESAFVVGQPTLALAGLTVQWAEKFMENGVGFGSRGGIVLPVGGSAQVLQAQPNTMPESGMTRKERQMIELGARLIQSGGGAETAEAARIKHSADASVLHIIVNNINQAYKDAIEAVQQFSTGSETDFTFKLNDNFFDHKLTAQELTAIVASWQAGAISKEVMQKKLVEGSIISTEVDLEEMNEAIDNTPSTVDFTE